MIKLPNTTSYRAIVESEHLYAESPFQLWTLSKADFVTTLREVGKLGTLAGVVAIIANSVFSYDHTSFFTVLTIGSATAWFAGYKLAQTLEPQAQEMLKFLRDLTERKKSTPPLTRFDISSPEELQRLRQNVIKLLIPQGVNNH